MLLHGQEHHADAVAAGFGQGKSEFGAFARKEFVRDLDQDASAVAGLRIAAAGAAMSQIDEDFDALADDFVRLLTVEIDHETHPAGVVLVAGVVEALADLGGYSMLYLTRRQYHVNRIYHFAILVLTDVTIM